MTTTDICYSRLLTYHQPGGESIYSGSQDKIELTFLSGSLYSSNTYLTGIISNLNLDSSAVFESSCFAYSCFQNSGIWSTALSSSVSTVVNGITQYFIVGSLDSEDNVWLLDLGYISPYSGKFIIEDSSVPISNNGYFTSRVTISPYTKVAVLKKVTPTQVIPVLYSYGNYSSNKSITRSSINYLLNYNTTDQTSNLEDLSIALLSLMFSQYKKSDQDGSYVFFKQGDVDLNIKQIIEDNLYSISLLLDQTSITNRVNSIPLNLTTYETSDLLYNDYYYTNNIIRCFDSDCFDSTCFEVSQLYIAPNREVSTKAIAWFYLVIYTYTVYYNSSTYSYLLEYLASYLISQIDPLSKLLSKGWTDSTLLADSTEIKEYNLPTAIISYIAILKHYNYSLNSIYLAKATDIQEGIFNNLHNYNTLNATVFYNSLTDNTLSIESLAYSLLFCKLVNRVDLVEHQINYVVNSTLIDYGILKEYLDPSSITSTVQLIDNLSRDNLIATPSNINFTSIVNGGSSLIEQTKYNLLLSLVIQSLQSDNYYIPLILDSKVKVFLSTISNIEETNNIISTCYCLTNFNPFSLEVIIENNYQLVNNLINEKGYLSKKIVSLLPKDYGWFNLAAFSPIGNLYKFLNSIFYTLSIYKVHSKNIITSNYLSSSYQYYLNQYISNFSITRIHQETDESLKEYISSVLAGEEDKITEKGLYKRMNRWGISLQSKEKYQDIMLLNSVDTMNSKLGEDSFIGNDVVSTNIIEVTVQQPIDDIILSEIQKALPIAVLPIFIETISLETTVSQSTCLKYTELINNQTNYLLQESSDYIKQEDDNLINLEQP